MIGLRTKLLRDKDHNKPLAKLCTFSLCQCYMVTYFNPINQLEKNLLAKNVFLMIGIRTKV